MVLEGNISGLTDKCEFTNNKIELSLITSILYQGNLLLVIHTKYKDQSIVFQFIKMAETKGKVAIIGRYVLECKFKQSFVGSYWD